MWEIPVVRGLLICEYADRSSVSGRLSLVNRVSSLRFRSFPSRPRDLTAFVQLVEGMGGVPITFAVEGPGPNERLIEQTTTVDFPDRLTEVPVLMVVTGIVFPCPGVYQVTVYAWDEPLTSHTLRVTTRDVPEGNG